MPLAQRPLEVMLRVQHSDMSFLALHSSIGTAPTVVAPSQSSTDGSRLGNGPPSGKKAVPEPNPMPTANCLRVRDDMAAPGGRC